MCKVGESQKLMEGFSLVEVVLALTIMCIAMGIAVSSLRALMSDESFAENLYIVNMETQRCIEAIRTDLMCSSKKDAGPYTPQVFGDELRFKVVRGFNAGAGNPNAAAIFSNYYVCFWRDTATNIAYRRFRTRDGALITPAMWAAATDPDVIEAKTDFPGDAAQPIGNYIADLTFPVDNITGVARVTLTVTATKGREESYTLATVTRTVQIIPYNSD